MLQNEYFQVDDLILSLALYNIKYIHEPSYFCLFSLFYAISNIFGNIVHNYIELVDN